MTTTEMLAERKRLLEEAKAIQATADEEDRGLAEDEEAKINDNLEAAKHLEAKIEAARETEKRQAALRSQLESADSWEDQPQPQQTRTILSSAAVGSDGASAPTIVGGEASGQWDCFGEFVFKVREAGMNPFADKRLEALTPQAAAPGMRKDVDSEGGFLIPVEYRTRLVDRMYGEGELLSRIKAAGMAFSLTGNTLKIPYVNETSRVAGSRWGGIRGYWVEEAASLTDSKAAFGQMELSLKKLACLGYITEEMLEDYSASGQFLENAFVSELTFMVEAAIVRGDGAAKPQGFLNADCAVSIAKETNQTAATIWGPNIVKMWARLWAGSRQTSVWLINQDVEPFLWSLTLEGRWGSTSTDAAGIPLYYPVGSELNRGKYGILMGRPVLPIEHCSTLGTQGDIMLVDPASYALADKAGGMKTASSIHVRFINDENTFRVTYRVDGQPTWPAALTPNQGTNTLSPDILLDTRS